MFRKGLYILTLLLLTSCARIPEPISYPYTQQPKMQAAHHWDILANDVANQINNELIINDYLETPVYVKTTCGDEDSPCEPYETSSFNEAFRDLLITELVSFGVPVQQQPDEDAIVVHYKVQVVYHKAPRARTIKPGFITSIATGIMVFRSAPHQFRTIASAGLADFMNQAAVMHSSHEIVISTSMVSKEKYLFRSSDIYYINDRDFLHYYESDSNTSEIPLISPGSGQMHMDEKATAKEPATTSKMEMQDIPDSTDI